jgi:hypothetical protein
VRQIREGGGMPSLAHPVRLPERDRESLEKLLRVLIDNGLQGLEVYHSEHSPEDTALYKGLAAQFNLIETGGTDFHGDNKPAIHLGTGKENNVNDQFDVAILGAGFEGGHAGNHPGSQRRQGGHHRRQHAPPVRVG